MSSTSAEPIILDCFGIERLRAEGHTVKQFEFFSATKKKKVLRKFAVQPAGKLSYSKPKKNQSNTTLVLY
jgi:hypothetical protein